MRELVLIHGRAQEHKDSIALKAEWISALEEGLRNNGLTLPIDASLIRFPYYGQTLFDLVSGVPAEDIAKVIVRGNAATAPPQEIVAVLEEIRTSKGISDADVRAEAEAAVVAAGEPGAVIARGPLNWPWVRGILAAIDRHVPGASGKSIALATRDVFQYLSSPGVRDKIDLGVRAGMTPGVESVVVSHSLGTVVAYNLMRRDGEALGWKVPTFITLGSPLGVTAIRQALTPLQHPSCVGKWLNARDKDDVVALYPLDETRFGIDPAIENTSHVDNKTSNQHGIAGYLSDATVAKWIHDALRA
jgi:hypothetical protein